MARRQHRLFRWFSGLGGGRTGRNRTRSERQQVRPFQTDFVGRQEALEAFRAHLERVTDDPDFRTIWYVQGRPGVGKTWLLREYQHMAQERDCLVVFFGKEVGSEVEAMAAVAAQLEKQDVSFGDFQKRYMEYRQRMREIEADTEAPSYAPIAKIATQGALGLAKGIPFVGGAIGALPEDKIADVVGEWTHYLVRRYKNKEVVRLLLEPKKMLAELFLKDLNKAAGNKRVAVFIDAFEQTAAFLEPWLHDLITAQKPGTTGDLVSRNVLWTLAGEQALDEQRWHDCRNRLREQMLKPFTEEEARRYLAVRGITDEALVTAIWQKSSGGLPLLIATYAANKPADPSRIADPSATIVEMTLAPVKDAARYHAALHTALARTFNRDVLAQVADEDTADDLFDWLVSMPFIEELSDGGWSYNPLIRASLLRAQRLRSPQQWEDRHAVLARYFEARRKRIALPARAARIDPMWQALDLEMHYHRLCENLHRCLPDVLAGFVEAFNVQHAYARRWADMLRQAGTDAGMEAVRQWGERLQAALDAEDADAYAEAVNVISELMETARMTHTSRALTLAWRGRTRSLLHQHAAAIDDFTAALAYDADVAEVYRMRGGAYFLEGRLAEAADDLSHLLVLTPDDAASYVQRSEVYRRLERFEEALDDLAAAEGLHFDEPVRLHTIRANILASLYRRDEALAEAEAALQLEPDNIGALGLKYTLAMLLGDLDKAAETQFAFQQAMIKGVSRMREMLAEIPADFLKRDLRNSFKLIFPNEQAADAAAAGYMALFEGEDDMLERLIRAEGKALEAVRFVRQGDFTKALTAINAALEVDSPVDNFWLIRGAIYEEMEHFDAALEDYTQAVKHRPNDVGSLIRRGTMYQRLQRHEDALADFRHALALAPEQFPLPSLIAQSYLALGKPEEALQALDDSVARNPEQPLPYLWRSEYYATVGDVGQALADLDHAIEIGYQEPPVPFHLMVRRVDFLQQLERFEEALAQLEVIIEQDPTRIDLHSRRLDLLRRTRNFSALWDEMATLETRIGDLLGQVRALLEAGKDDEARRIYVEKYGVLVAHLPEGSIDQLMDALKTDPEKTMQDTMVGLYVSNAEVLWASGQRDAALKSMDIALERAPFEATLWLHRAEYYVLLKRSEDALQALEHTQSLAFDLPALRYQRADLYRRLEHFDEALADFDAALAQRPDYVEALARRGATHRKLGDDARALADFDRAVALKDDDAWTYLQRGQLHLDHQHPETALSDFNRVTTLEPENELAWVYVLTAHIQCKHAGEALSLANDLIEKKSADDYRAFIFRQRGVALAQLKRYDEALADFDRALAARPDNLELQQLRADALRRAGRFNEAVATLEHLLEQMPDENWFRYLIGLARQAQGRTRQARQHFEQALASARAHYDDDPQNWANAFNIGLYELACTREEAATAAYERNLAAGAPDDMVQTATDDIDDLLGVFPGYEAAVTLRDRLNDHLHAAAKAH